MGFQSLGGRYQGSSFFELLQVDYKHLLPDLSAWGRSAAEFVPHGTTVLAMKFDTGVLVAGDQARDGRALGRVARRGQGVRDGQLLAHGDLGGSRSIHRDGADPLRRARALREDRGRGARTRGQGEQALADDPAEPARRDAGPRRGAHSSPASTSAARPDACGSLTSPAVATKRPSSTRRARAGSTRVSRSSTDGMSTSVATTPCVWPSRHSLRPPTRIGRPAVIDLERRIFPVVKLASKDGIEDGRGEDRAAYRD